MERPARDSILHVCTFPRPRQNSHGQSARAGALFPLEMCDPLTVAVKSYLVHMSHRRLEQPSPTRAELEGSESSACLSSTQVLNSELLSVPCIGRDANLRRGLMATVTGMARCSIARSSFDTFGETSIVQRLLGDAEDVLPALFAIAIVIRYQIH